MNQLTRWTIRDSERCSEPCPHRATLSARLAGITRVLCRPRRVTSVVNRATWKTKARPASGGSRRGRQRSVSAGASGSRAVSRISRGSAQLGHALREVVGDLSSRRPMAVDPGSPRCRKTLRPRRGSHIGWPRAVLTALESSGFARQAGGAHHRDAPSRWALGFVRGIVQASSEVNSAFAIYLRSPSVSTKSGHRFDQRGGARPR